jgi:hypothetical protein
MALKPGCAILSCPGFITGMLLKYSAISFFVMQGRGYPVTGEAAGNRQLQYPGLVDRIFA